MFSALIWKDLRVNRPVLVLAAAFALACYAMMAVTASLDPTASSGPWGPWIGAVLLAGSVASHAVSQISISVLAGNIIAVERIDRSAEFLAYLPASRRTILSAKAAVLGGVVFALTVIHLIGAVSAIALVGSPTSRQNEFDPLLLGVISAFGFCGSGVGWLASCMVRSNAIAILLAMSSPILTALTTRLVVFVFDPLNSTPFYVVAWLIVGATGFVWGTRHYLRRVEP